MYAKLVSVRGIKIKQFEGEVEITPLTDERDYDPFQCEIRTTTGWWIRLGDKNTFFVPLDLSAVLYLMNDSGETLDTIKLQQDTILIGK